MKKLNVGIVFGGRSPEHEISLQSAKNIIENIDIKRFNITLIGIDKIGAWGLYDTKKYLQNEKKQGLIRLGKPITKISLVPSKSKHNLISIDSKISIPEIDIFFPVLHGSFGEDGTIQGLFELMDIPYVGAGCLGSAIGMDKDVSKRLLKEANILVCKFMTITKSNWKSKDKIILKEVENLFTFPIFIKPANAGSSIGISKVNSIKQLNLAILEAFKYDDKILIEQGIFGREIEVSVLGNENPIVSLPGELIPKNGFYSYDAKYIDPNGARMIVPAKLDKEIIKNIQTLAIKTYNALCCSCMARVDFFYDEKNSALYVNELNTIPGFTAISMYPKLWEVSGIKYKDLITRLIYLAIEKYNRK